MKESSQTGANQPFESAGPLDCAAVELWLAEAAEENLPSAIAARIRAHGEGCAGCREKLEQARRGREWLRVLQQEVLEPPPELAAKILARTSGAGNSPGLSAPVVQGPERSQRIGYPGAISALESETTQPEPLARSRTVGYAPGAYTAGPAAYPALPAWQRTSLVALRHKIMEPRLALVAAMAFFSISLTLNLVGVHITSLRAVDLQPSNLRRTVSRQYAEANAHIVRYYENLRIVYEVESRVQQLRRAAETAPVPPPPSGAKPRQGSSDSSRDPGRLQNGQRDGIAGNVKAPARKNAAPPDPAPIVTGPRMDVALPTPRGAKICGNAHVVLVGGAKGLAPDRARNQGSHLGLTFAAERNALSPREERRLA